MLTRCLRAKCRGGGAGEGSRERCYWQHEGLTAVYRPPCVVQRFYSVRASLCLALISSFGRWSMMFGQWQVAIQIQRKTKDGGRGPARAYRQSPRGPQLTSPPLEVSSSRPFPPGTPSTLCPVQRPRHIPTPTSLPAPRCGRCHSVHVTQCTPTKPPTRYSHRYLSQGSSNCIAG